MAAQNESREEGAVVAVAQVNHRETGVARALEDGEYVAHPLNFT